MNIEQQKNLYLLWYAKNMCFFSFQSQNVFLQGNAVSIEFWTRFFYEIYFMTIFVGLKIEKAKWPLVGRQMTFFVLFIIFENSLIFQTLYLKSKLSQK